MCQVRNLSLCLIQQLCTVLRIPQSGTYMFLILFGHQKEIGRGSVLDYFADKETMVQRDQGAFKTHYKASK